MVEANAALVVADENFDSGYVLSSLIPLISNTKRIAEMSEKAKELGLRDGAERLLKLVNGVLKV